MMSDVDELEGQVLAVAVAVEVMGLEYRENEFGVAWWCEVRPDGGVVGKFQVDRWHPESTWCDFGNVVDRLCSLDLDVLLSTGHGHSECSVWHNSTIDGQLIMDPLVRQLGGANLFETGCRAAVKGVRARGSAWCLPGRSG